MDFGRNWTEPLKQALLLGKIGKWVMPFTLTIYQLGAFIGTFALTLIAMIATKHLRAGVPAVVNILVMLGLPVGAAWATPHLKLEGRGPVGALYGLASYALSPKRGIYQGRPWKQPKAEKPSGHWSLRMVRHSKEEA